MSVLRHANMALPDQVRLLAVPVAWMAMPVAAVHLLVLVAQAPLTVLVRVCVRVPTPLAFAAILRAATTAMLQPVVHVLTSTRKTFVMTRTTTAQTALT